jgi:uncharacterized protein
MNTIARIEGVTCEAQQSAGPSRIELVLLALTGVGHVALEVASQGLKGAADSLNQPQHWYNLAACAAWGSYLVWRAIKTPAILKAWGFRRDGFAASLKVSTALAALALVPLLLYGRMMGRLPLPSTFWVVLALYPLWGLAQQFALQGLITRNLRELVPQLAWRVPVASVIFSASHFPNYQLMVLTFIAGLVFTWVYEKYGNLWAIGLVHGVLGAVAYYLVLGLDPGSELIGR